MIIAGRSDGGLVIIDEWTLVIEASVEHLSIVVEEVGTAVVVVVRAISRVKGPWVIRLLRWIGYEHCGWSSARIGHLNEDSSFWIWLDSLKISTISSWHLILSNLLSWRRLIHIFREWIADFRFNKALGVLNWTIWTEFWWRCACYFDTSITTNNGDQTLCFSWHIGPAG